MVNVNGLVKGAAVNASLACFGLLALITNITWITNTLLVLFLIERFLIVREAVNQMKIIKRKTDFSTPQN